MSEIAEKLKELATRRTRHQTQETVKLDLLNEAISTIERLEAENKELVKAVSELIRMHFTAEHLDMVSNSDIGSRLKVLIQQHAGGEGE